MFRRKGPDYYKGSKDDKVMFVSGIPSRYWSVTEKHPSFNSFSQPRPYHRKDQITLNAKRQYAYFQSLNTVEALKESVIVGISAVPTDDLAMAAAVVLAKTAIKGGLNVECIDLGNPPPVWSQENMEVPDVLVLHNIMSDTDYVRFMQCRDWLRWGEDSCRIVVASGTNPVDLFDNKLRIPFDYAFYGEGALIMKRRTA